MPEGNLLISLRQDWTWRPGAGAEKNTNPPLESGSGPNRNASDYEMLGNSGDGL